MGLARVVGCLVTGSFAYTAYLWYFYDPDSFTSSPNYVKVIGSKAKSIPTGSLPDDGISASFSKPFFHPKDPDTVDDWIKRVNAAKANVSKSPVSSQ